MAFRGRGEAAPRPYKNETGPFTEGAGFLPAVCVGGAPALRRKTPLLNTLAAPWFSRVFPVLRTLSKTMENP